MDNRIAYINTKNLIKNINLIKNKIGNSCKIMAIVKSNAYGHNINIISKVCSENGILNFGVATIDEGIELRKSGITQNILILSDILETRIYDALKYNLTLTVSSISIANHIQIISSNLNIKCKIHIKIDTGMSRIGFLPTIQSINDIVCINKLSNIELEGIFSHFSQAELQNDEFTKLQYEHFIYVVNSLSNLGITNLVRHISNSAGLINYDYNLDMVRTGIFLYGIYPTLNLKNYITLFEVLTLKSYITFVKNIEKDAVIGYGCTFKALKHMKIATVALGYGDGYARCYSKGYVLVLGQKAKILGDICMDQLMIDVSGINVKIGDSVTFIGSDKENKITVYDLAKLNNTIPYEVICQIGNRVQRISI